MNKFLICLLGMALCAGVAAVDPADFAREQLKNVVPGTITLKAPNGWMYSRNELEHLAKGKLAGGAVEQISAAAKNRHPLPALAAFNRDLKSMGIKLIVVPVPPKLAAQPFGELKSGEALKYLRPFYAELRAAGIDVLDIGDDLAAVPGAYCRQDAHWAPPGISAAAKKIAAATGLKSGNAKFTATEKALSIRGDLLSSLDKNAPPNEKLTIRQISGGVFDDGAPLLVIGDSHTLVFSTGNDMLAENAGICEQLAAELNTPVERIGVKGSAATAVRVNLYRKAVKNPKWLENKKAVVYIFSCREFTESASGWVRVPVMRNK